MPTVLSTRSGVYAYDHASGAVLRLDVTVPGTLQDISVGRDGTLYMLTSDNVLAYDRGTGQATSLIDLSSSADSLAQDEDDNFYVGFAGKGRLEVFSGSGFYGDLAAYGLPPEDVLSGDLVATKDEVLLTTAAGDFVLLSLSDGSVTARAPSGRTDITGLSYHADDFFAFSPDAVFVMDQPAGRLDLVGPVSGLDGPITGAAALLGSYVASGTGAADAMVATFWNDDIKAGRGNDTVDGLVGNDTLAGQVGDDVLGGGVGDDLLRGGRGGDLLEGGTGDDVLRGQAGDDRLFGGDDNDNAKGGGGSDFVDGGAGNDFLTGGRQGDALQGGSGDDRLFGNREDDTLTGDAGNDTLKGGGGDDYLASGAGNDFLKGGGGSDTFVFVDIPFGHDRITDFEDGIDRLFFSAEGYAQLTVTNTAGGTLIESTFGEVLLIGVDRALIDQDDFLSL